MLSLTNDGRYPALALDPQQRRRKTLDALGAQLEALAHQRPVLMIFEDAHWSDPTSLEALSHIVEQIKTLPVLLIATTRRGSGNRASNGRWVQTPRRVRSSMGNNTAATRLRRRR